MATDSSPIRPTKAVVVKALRDMVRPVVDGLVVLDLFAGTARVGEGLLEEGARRVFAVDRREEPEELPDQIQWFQRDVDTFLRHGPPEPVGLVYLDPPYDEVPYDELIDNIARAEWLERQGLIAVETARDTHLPDGTDLGLDLKRNRRYGSTRLWIYQDERSGEDEADQSNSDSERGEMSG